MFGAPYDLDGDISWSSDEEGTEKRRRRKPRKRSKESMIYGVFLESSGDEARAQRRQKPSGRRKKIVKESSSDTETVPDFFQKEDGDQKEVKFVSSNKNVQQTSTVTVAVQPAANYIEGFSSYSSSSEGDDDGDTPVKETKTATLRSKSKTRPILSSNTDQTNDDTSSIPIPVNCALEKRYGVGFSLMARMGYKGGGLGAEGQGRVAPIEVEVRKKNEGLREKSQIRKRAKNIDLADLYPNDEGDDPIVAGIDKLLRESETYLTGGREDKGQKTTHREKMQSYTEDIRELEKIDVDVPQQSTSASINHPRIVDMRGNKVVIIENGNSDDLTSLLSKDSAWKSAGIAGELPLLNDDFLNRSGESSYSAQFIAGLEQVKKILEDLQDRMPKEAIKDPKKAALTAKYSVDNSSSSIKAPLSKPKWDEGDIDVVEVCRTAYIFSQSYGVSRPDNQDLAIVSEPLSVTELTTIIKGLRDKYPDEVEFLELSKFSGDQYLGPLLAKEANDWDIPRNPKKWLKPSLLFWRGFLCNRKATEGKNMRLSRTIWNYVIEKRLKTFIFNEWKPIEECEVALDLVLDWMRHWLTEEAQNKFVRTNIVPRLKTEIQRWEPADQTMRPHLWIHPWLVHLDPTSRDDICSLVLRKFKLALRQWNPTDTSAALSILPWKVVFAPADWKIMVQDDICAAIDVWLSDIKAVLDSRMPNTLQQIVTDWGEFITSERISKSVMRFYAPRLLTALNKGGDVDSLDLEAVLEGYEKWRNLADTVFQDLDPFVKKLVMHLHAMMKRSSESQLRDSTPKVVLPPSQIPPPKPLPDDKATLYDIID